LVIPGSGVLDDRVVADLPRLLRPGDLLVFNDTRVIPARLAGRVGAAKVEATLLERAAPDAWTALAKPGRKLKPGTRVDFGDIAAEVIGKEVGGVVHLRFDRAGEALDQAIELLGSMPLPPYIAKRRAPDERDRSDYQTSYAKDAGAVAAPTAGLHFTGDLRRHLAIRGVEQVFVTLHVGAGTFLPVKSETTEGHRMHAEWGRVEPEVAATIARARTKGRRVIAVGTTALRLLEAAAREGAVGPWTGRTDIFITPGYRFRVVDALITNFHLPRSTLFMLVAAFAGLERMKAAYAHAIASGYRFYSYGDASLIERAA